MADGNRENSGKSASENHEEIRVSFDWSDVNPSSAIVETVATLANCDPLDLEPLFNSVDPDALDSLLDSGKSDPAMGTTTVTFRLNEFEVTGQSDGTVLVSHI